MGQWTIDLFLRNPVAWFLLALLLLAEYWNYEKGVELDAVCEAVPFADVLPYKPKTDLERAQLICDERRTVPDMPDE
jgi:hypothetical protein